MLIYAHRGYSAKYPENTMKAFVEAYNRGFDGIETDVQMTRDGELVLIHDEKIDRTSNGEGYVKDYYLHELLTFNFSNKHEGFYQIPTLKELLMFIKGKNIMLNLEIKTDCIQYPDIEKKVLQLVEEIGVEKQIIYSSFYLPSLLTLRELNPSLYLGYLIENQYVKRKQQLLEHDIHCFHPRYTFINKKSIVELKKDNLFLVVWTVPNQKQFDRIKKLGVDIAICNEYFE